MASAPIWFARKISKVEEIILIIRALSIIIALFITNNLDFLRVAVVKIFTIFT